MGLQEAPEPELDLSDQTVRAAAAALPQPEQTDGSLQGPAPVNCVVAPGLDEAEPAPEPVVLPAPEGATTPSPEYFDTEPKDQPSDCLLYTSTCV